MCQRLSSTTRCFTATCECRFKCCILQPPHAPACMPKLTHSAFILCDDACRICLSVPCSQLFFFRCTLTVTRSNGNAPSTKTTLPSDRCAMPWASKSIDSISNPLSSIKASVVSGIHCISAVWQQLDGINRFALFANFKMQLDLL